MLKDKKLSDFCELVLKIGVNLQKEQGLLIVCPVDKYEIAKAFTKKAYELGAKIVQVRWEAEEIDRLNYLNAQTSVLSEVPKWVVENRNYLMKNNFCYVAISAENPSAFSDVSPEKLNEVAKARSKALKKFSDCVMANGIRWCVISVPTLAWAKQVFPQSPDPEEDLSLAIESTMRLNEKEPLKAWENHIETLERRANFLNGCDFDYLIYTNKKGTDLKVGLAKNHVWLSAKERAKDGVDFAANMPTEEVFTCPDKNRTQGVLRSALPLCYNGHIIDDFTITFNKGKIVSVSAKKGEKVLKELVNTDKGTHYLGEVALIGKNSPISKSKILFYNTLFDENASCHLAIGKAYPTTVKNGNELDRATLSSYGVNDSVEHVDFMIGTSDLNIVGVKKNGEKIQIFSDGEWTF